MQYRINFFERYYDDGRIHMPVLIPAQAKKEDDLIVVHAIVLRREGDEASTTTKKDEVLDNS